MLAFDGSSDTDLTNRYLWGPVVDQILADEQVTSLASAGHVIWPLTDHLGTARDLAQYNAGTDTTSITNHRVYDSFGNLVYESDDGVTILFGFTARPFDVESGLQWNLNRWYISTLGVWMSEDPIGFAAGDASLRRYVANTPLIAIDPNGTDRRIVSNGHAWLEIGHRDDDGNWITEWALDFGLDVADLDACQYYIT